MVNEWNSTAPFSLTTDGGADFQIATSQINDSTSGAPGAYPALYRGCHWSTTFCTTNSGLPVQVSRIDGGGVVTSSASTTTATSGAWDDAYDIWFNQASSTHSNSGPGSLEMMVWLTCGANSRSGICPPGPVQPAGSVVARNVSIGGHTYDVWHGGSSPGGTVSYTMSSPTTSVSKLDIGLLAADAVNRGFMPPSWFLIDAEFGSEPWIGGAGFAVNSFNVCDSAGC